MRPSKFLSALCSLLLALFLLTAAIAVPILCRPLYYAQIDALDLTENTGWDEKTIRGAYDQVMDYLVGNAPFGTGKLKWSENGRAHFADCRVLFRLDFALLGVSAAGLLLLGALRWGKRISLHRFCGRSPAFWALVGMTAVLLALLCWALVDFESLFTAFHTVFFPGKSNWIFDWQTDEIILILPEAFWARCGAVVAALAFGGGALLTAVCEWLHWRRSPKSVYESAKLL
ncbi:MAG: TIGR01906 family membrane protein [Lachnospirales bacterium]